MLHGWAIIRENQRKFWPLFEASHARFCLMSFLHFIFCENFVKFRSNYSLSLYYIYVFLLMTISLKYPKNCARQRQSRHTRKFSIRPPAWFRLLRAHVEVENLLPHLRRWKMRERFGISLCHSGTVWVSLSKNENNLLFEPRSPCEIIPKCRWAISPSSWNVLLNILQLRHLRLSLDKRRTGVESTWRTGRAHSSQSHHPYFGRR